MLSYQKLKDACLHHIFIVILYWKSQEKKFLGFLWKDPQSILWKSSHFCTLKLAGAVITWPDTAEDFRIVFSPFIWFSGSVWMAVAFSGWQWLSLASASCCVPVYMKLISVPRPETLTWADRDETFRVGRNKKRTLTEASCSHYRTQPPPTLVDVFLIMKNKMWTGIQQAYLKRFWLVHPLSN